MPMPQDDDPRHDTRERLYRGAAVPDDARIGLATDIGLRHATNQDYAGIDFAPSGPYWVVVVADGVSSTPGAERASHIAATTICQHLTDALGDGLPTGDDATIALFTGAFDLAHERIVTSDGEPVGACTVAAAIHGPSRVVVANIGDTRAFWFPGDGKAVRLTTDDSVAQMQIEMGVPRDRAEHGAGAHAITKWIGARATDITPRVVAYEPTRSGWLLLCSDGVWNYAADPADLAALVSHIDQHGAGPHQDAQTIAEGLVRHALSCGGHDNATVACVHLTDES
ncbi:PP2C family protein-serine/threonine phosphatase [Cutibacterium granulosum]|uniref:PP2C family protein-serine/threonine phosphatase n=1 Tax=Cutibacterium granulosum TaxID=33011 RepID=UPI000DB20C0C|nr:PP2C family serine/threonine-protein phosphatase [Cutibacterium granulosum]MDU1862150.1 PP2C family serine/threonine-protein phosphatase [Propionibacterium sp.]MDU1581393.1 PP2C family serine/threonine-protein phosphatase [Cutibacterium granulosum]MDU4678190.1 PP2C family serine/threonine-protein phosphatase [Cutibacterium granulosum]MDU6338071.1 PP2C family serine/threonine-protein phosphatase [Cutibacterium granulosum]MDU7727974.1 PP2C family serine/threonine-protein phosphatase [Cutibact